MLKVFNKKNLIFVCVLLVVAVCDFVTKIFTEGKFLKLINGVVSVYSTHNTGGAWSILSNGTIILIVLSSIFIILFMIFYLYSKSKNILFFISLSMIISGAMCNLYDRISFGYVRDFICLDFMSFPIFNIADCSIVIGVILLCGFIIFSKNKKSECLSGGKID